MHQPEFCGECTENVVFQKVNADRCPSCGDLRVHGPVPPLSAAQIALESAQKAHDRNRDRHAPRNPDEPLVRSPEPSLPLSERLARLRSAIEQREFGGTGGWRYLPDLDEAIRILSGG